VLIHLLCALEYQKTAVKPVVIVSVSSPLSNHSAFYSNDSNSSHEVDKPKKSRGFLHFFGDKPKPGFNVALDKDKKDVCDKNYYAYDDLSWF
jgi:hypothetical protein